MDTISEHLTGFIAEVLQAWLDAGSERDVTLENLYDPIHKEVGSWAVDAELEQNKRDEDMAPEHP